MARDLVRVDVDGDRQLHDTARRAADDLDDLEPVDQAAATIAANRARAIAPKASGYLASTIRADDGNVVATAPYAGVIEYGWPARNIKPQPYLTQAVAVTEAQLVALYAHHTDETIHDIKGK